MQVLALNAGSSSLKFRLFGPGGGDDAAAGANEGSLETLARGVVSHIGPESALEWEDAGGSRRCAVSCKDHLSALDSILREMRERRLLRDGGTLVTGHRIVHGGQRFREPTVVTPIVLGELRALSRLAPLHNAAACDVLEKSIAELGHGVPAVAVFDTAFHAEMPPRAALHAIPWQLAEKHGIRRFGFHGLAHQWMSERWSNNTSRARGAGRIVTLQLGHGCSAAAVRAGRSLDVTMGFSPLEGLMMGTRSGDVDPALVSFLIDREGVDARTVEGWLQTRSGLLGVSGASSDLRVLLGLAAQDDPRARLAVEMFCYRIQKSIGAMLAVLGGVDAIVFSGGIGENSSAVRARTAGTFAWCGVELDPAKNDEQTRTDRCISTATSPVEVWIIPAEEELLIARAVLRRFPDGPAPHAP